MIFGDIFSKRWRKNKFIVLTQNAAILCQNWIILLTFGKKSQFFPPQIGQNIRKTCSDLNNDLPKVFAPLLRKKMAILRHFYAKNLRKKLAILRHFYAKNLRKKLAILRHFYAKNLRKKLAILRHFYAKKLRKKMAILQPIADA
jgi:hypothetical protein